MAINVVAALALKEIMERDGMEGTMQLWPGVAEEVLGSKQHMVAAGALEDVDAMISNHVGNGLGTAYGQSNTMGMVSVEYTFKGVSAHGAVAPWLGRSALDAVDLMDAGWNFRREHLRPQQRSHYIISNGGAQPNVVPNEASVWYYLRETSAEEVSKMYEIANDIADGAALMTGTTVEHKLLGSAWPHHYNQALAEAMYANIETVGMPEWSEDDIALGQGGAGHDQDRPDRPAHEINPLGLPVAEVGSGPSDDIGAVTWTVPSVRLSFPANIPGHHHA